MNSILKIVVDMAPYVFAAIGLEVLSSKIRKLNERVSELEGEVARSKPSEPHFPHLDAVERQKERTLQFDLEYARRQSSEAPK